MRIAAKPGISRVTAVLLALLILVLPASIGETWAAGPENTLVYNGGDLTWYPGMNVLPDGTTELELFDAVYGTTVEADDGVTALIAPGTELSNQLCLKSIVSGPIDYTIVLYYISSSPEVPLVPSLEGGGLKDTASYSLPTGVTKDQVIRAVSGTLPGVGTLDFFVNWKWLFEVSEEQNLADTALGDKEVLDNVTLGLYIVVEDDNVYHPKPKTGDESNLVLYGSLMGLSVLSFAGLVWWNKRGKSRV